MQYSINLSLPSTGKGIYGVGVDIVNIKRIQKLYSNYQQKFINKVLTDFEISVFKNIKREQMQVKYLAKRFAAKEAISKALGTGICEYCTFHDIEISNDCKGKPQAFLSRKTFDYFFSNGQCDIYLSISDEFDFAIAYAVLYIVAS